jgi:hypothetical protein
MRKLLTGAISGLLATVPMTVVIFAGRLLFMRWTPPPKQITKSVAERDGIEPVRSSEELEFGWSMAHLAYGAACGAIYSVMQPALPGPRAVKGLMFGGIVWGVSYLGFVPALGLYPWPKDDSRTRIAVMIAAHAVFGVNTAQFEELLSNLNEDADCYVTLQPPQGLTSQRA